MPFMEENRSSPPALSCQQRAIKSAQSVWVGEGARNQMRQAFFIRTQHNDTLILSATTLQRVIDSNNTMALTETQWKVLAIIPHFSGFLSLAGSLSIIQDIVRDRKKLGRVYHRLMLGISILDVLTSSAYFMSTWPVPRDKAGPVQFALGTQGTCTAQGFFVQTSLALPFYNLALAIYYRLVLKLRWSDIRIMKIEKFLHIIPLILGVGTSIASLRLELFNNSNLWCWISGLPGSCSNTPDGDGNCIRGDDAWIYRWAFFYAPLWGVILIITILMGEIVLFVMRQEKQSRQWRMGDANGVDTTGKLSRQVFWQSIHYVCIFYLTYTFPTILRLLQTLEKPVPYAVFVSMTIFLPLQGFFNASVYFGPRIRRSLGNKKALGASRWTPMSRSSIGASGMEQSKSRNESAAGENGQSGTLRKGSETSKDADGTSNDDEINDVSERTDASRTIGKRVDMSAEVIECTDYPELHVKFDVENDVGKDNAV